MKYILGTVIATYAVSEYAIGLILVAIAAAIFLSTQRKKRPSYGAVNGWKINWSRGLPTAPTPQGQGWAIDVPPGASLHYVQRYGGSLREGQALNLRLRVTGQFIAPEFGNPANASILLQRKDDSGRESGYRYCSLATIPLTEGEHEMTVPVDAAHFKDVLTETGALTKVLADLESVGVIFGSDGGRGHGVEAPNGGRVELLRLS